MSQINSENISYNSGNVTLEAYCAKPELTKTSNKLPVVLICHAWAGRDQFVIDTANKLAELGYVAVAIDVYGKGVLGSTTEEKMALMQPLLDNREELQQRLRLGYDAVVNLDNIDKSKISAIGYCFGGLCVLDMARMGLNLAGVISIHGLFNKPDNLNNYKINSKVLALHGHLDPMVSQNDVNNFMTELDQAEAMWQINNYGMAKHAFTNPEAHDNNLGTVYNQLADSRSWKDICNFLAECSE